MSSPAWHRLLHPGLLLFGASLALSKSASTILLVALYAAMAYGATRDPQFRADLLRCGRQPLTAALALFCLVAYLGIIHTKNPSDGFKVANKFVSLPAIYFLVAALLQSNRDEAARARQAESLLLSYVAGLAALNLLGALTFVGALGGAPFATPLSPLGLHHIWYSNLNALGLYAAVSLLLFSRHGGSPRARALLGSFVLLSAVCVVLSASRTAWLSIILTAVIMATLLIRSKKTIVLVLLLCALTTAAAYRFVPIVHDRVDLAAKDLALYAENKKAESSIGGRILMWRAAYRMFTWHPYIGVGTGDYQQMLKVFRRSRLVPFYLLAFNQPHNMYLFSMATNGAVGLAALLYIFYRSLRVALPAVRAGGEGKLFAFLATATVVHFMIAGFFDSFFNIQVLRYSFLFIMGVCIRGCANRDRQP